MIGVARKEIWRAPQRRSASWTLLVQLGEARELLLQQLENLALISLGPPPDDGALTVARWRISDAGLRRQSLTIQIAAFLIDRVDDRDLVRLQSLQAEDQQMLRRSSQHVGTWTMQAVHQDWKGYCKAARDYRMQMKAHLLLEKQVLYPQLERLADRGI